MKHSTIHSLLAILLFIASTLVACQNETIPDIDDNAKTGRIVLSLQNVEVFTEVTTRATGNVGDYTYTLSGTDIDNNVVTDQPINFTDGSAIIPAGTYTLTATSITAQDADPWYQGTSASFELGIGDTQAITIDLGKPQNAAIAVTFDASFINLYENCSVTICDHTINVNGNLYTAIPNDGKVTYTIKGSAKQNSHVSDIPEAGITGTLTVAAGMSYPLNITALSISDLMIGIDNGIHAGAFDVKRQ